jgi:flagellar hook-associated protein 2
MTTTTASSSLLSNLGVGSGLDLTTLYNNLQTAEETKLTPIANQKTLFTTKLSAYGQIQSALSSLQTATTALSTASDWNATSVTSSNTAFSATTSSSATTGNYAMNVKQLATAQVLMSGSFSSQTSQLGATTGGTRTITISQSSSSTPLTVTLADSDTTLSGIASAINKANGGVTATVVKASDTDYRLMLTSNTTGANSAMTVSVTGDSTLQSAIGYDSTASSNGMSVQTAAQDAIVTLNGVSIQRSSNTISDALPGVTLNLKSVSTADETLAISRATDQNTAAINNWVTAYNNVQSTLTSMTQYTPVAAGASSQSSSNGPLVGDGNVRAIQNQLRGLLTNVQSGGSYSIMAQLGITQDPTTGQLNVDSTKLSTALTNDPSGVMNYFIGDGKTTGFATQMGNTLTSMLSTATGNSGIIQNAEDSINATLKTLTDKYTEVQNQIDATMANYKSQFTALDTLMSQLSSTSSYLTSQFSSSSNG